jgi:hypothetical protein
LRPSGISHEEYTAKAASAFPKNISVKEYMEFDDAVSAVEENFYREATPLYWLLSYTKQHHECSCSKHKKGTLPRNAGRYLQTKHANH